MLSRLLVAFVATSSSLAGAAEVDPLGKAVELLNALAAKVTDDGVREDKAYHEYFEWCDESSHQKMFEIKTYTLEEEKLESTITKAESDIEAASAKIDDLAGKIGQGQKELKDATEIRHKEAEEFKEAEGELVESIDALGRAIGVIEKEMAKNPASFAQVDTSSLSGLLNAISTIVDAASLANADKSTLVALVQSQAGSDDEDSGAPDPAVYTTHSKGIVEVLEDMKDKAETQLADLRKAESNNKQNYELLKGSLDAQIEQDTKNMDEENAFKAETEETLATSKKDLVATTAALKDSKAALESIQSECMKVAADHDQSVKDRSEELKVLAEAKKVLMETTSGASEQTYSFVQVSSKSQMRVRVSMKQAQVIHLIKQLARVQHSSALAQLASRIAALARYGAQNGEDPFVKVKGLISDMIRKLEAEMEAAAKEKAYCDEQMSKTEAKKEELEDDMSRLTAKIDKKTAQASALKEEVKELQEELAALAKEQSEMDDIRKTQNEAYKAAKADLELGLEGVGKALKILRKYYGAKATEDAFLQQPAKPVPFKKAEGAGGSIIDILEVCESDFAKTLSSTEEEEADSKAAYEKRTQEIKESTAIKQKDVQYKVQEFKALDTEVAQLSEDRDATDKELQAVLEYYAKVKERCVAKPESYEERKKRREAEITGLKQALEILEDDSAALVQVASRKKRVSQFHLRH
jgi:chromosome segregation ATPase